MSNRKILEKVDRIIHGLPTRPDPDSFYDLVDASSWLKKRRWKQAANKLFRLASRLSNGRSNTLRFAADCLIASEDFVQAITYAPRPLIGTRATAFANKTLSLKAHVGQDVNGEDIILLFGPKLTKFGCENLSSIQSYIDVQLEFRRADLRRSIIEAWCDEARISPSGGMSLFSGHHSYILTKKCQSFSFHLSAVIENECASLLRDAENTYREDQKLPRIAEGWVSETRLFYEIKGAFPNEDVLQHASPAWLGKQHLDIFIPSLKLGIEYQGRQHLEPVAFFGGEEAFRKTIERDRRKMRKCTINNAKLLYVYENYDLQQVLLEINSAIRN